MVWCPYCGQPLSDKNYIKGWSLQSPKGGLRFIAKMYQCHKCDKKVRITQSEEEELAELEKNKGW